MEGTDSCHHHNESMRQGYHQMVVHILLQQQARCRRIGHNPVEADAGHHSVARPYRTLGTLRNNPRLIAVLALDGAFEYVMRAPSVAKVSRMLCVVVVALSTMIVEVCSCYPSLCGVYSSELSNLVSRHSLTDLSRHRLPSRRVARIRGCLGWRLFGNNLMRSRPHWNSEMLIDRNLRLAIEL